MKHFFLLFIFISATLGCQNKNQVSTDPKENRYYRIYNEIYNEWGKISLDSTQQKLDEYLEEFPENSGAQMLAGNIAYSMAEYEKAIACYRAAICIQPQQAIYYSALGTAFNTQNQVDSAEKYLMKAIALNDSSLYTFLNASVLYMKKQEKKKSFAFADSAYVKGNSLPVICSGLSFVYHQWNEEEKSRNLFERAVALGLKDTLAFHGVLDSKMKLEDYYRINY